MRPCTLRCTLRPWDHQVFNTLHGGGCNSLTSDIFSWFDYSYCNAISLMICMAVGKTGKGVGDQWIKPEDLGIMCLALLFQMWATAHFCRPNCIPTAWDTPSTTFSVSPRTTWFSAYIFRSSVKISAWPGYPGTAPWTPWSHWGHGIWAQCLSKTGGVRE